MIEIKRNNTTVASSHVYSYSGTHMGNMSVSVKIESPDKVDFQKGDTVDFRENTFVLREVPNAVKAFNSPLLEYNLTFEHEVNIFKDISFLDVIKGSDASEAYYNNTGDVLFIGTIETLLNRLIANLERVTTGWSFVIDPTIVLNEEQVVLSNQYCSDALELLQSLFKVEYQIEGKTIKIIDTKKSVGGTFSFGKDNGLCNITRTADKERVIKRIRVYGATRNIPSDYNVTSQYKYNPRLMLPNFKTTGINYVDSPLLANGETPSEGILVNEEIYPSINDGTGRNEVVSMEAIGDDDAGFYLNIKDLGFNIEDKLVAGKTPKLSMISGLLKGYEFEIVKIEPSTVIGATTRLQLRRNTDIENHPLPNNITVIKLEDRFVLLDIAMDQSYIINAEQRLLDWANKRFSEENIDKEKATYSIKIPAEDIQRQKDSASPRYDESRIKEGNTIHIQDTDLGVDKEITIQSLSISFGGTSLIPDYDITISDKVVASGFARAVNEATTDTRQRIREVETVFGKDNDKLERNYESLARQTTSNIEKLDELGKAEVFGEYINNFILSSRIIQNYDGNPNKVFCSIGKLVHRSEQVYWGGINSDDHKIFSINTDETLILPDSSKLYYLYLKLNKFNGSAEFIFSETEKEIQDDDFFYCEWGVLFQVINGERSKQATKGITAISGSNIYSGKISSLDGNNYFDLENGAQKIGTSTSGMDYGVTNPNQLTIRGTIVQSPSGITEPLGVWRGNWQPTTPYYKGDRVFYEGSSYLAKEDNTNNIPTGDKWNIMTQKGDAFKVDEQGLLANRPDPTTHPVGYTFFATDTSLLYFIQAGNPNTWSDGTPFGKGDKGDQGDQGLKGPAGADGRTTYLHIAYANSPSGIVDFSVSDPTNKEYIGQYVDFTQTDSTNPNDYKWSKIKGDQGLQGLQGDKGDQGIKGSDGIDGKTSFFHIAYADNENGDGFSQTPTGKDYIGTYVDFIQTDSTDPSDYNWVLTKGIKGDQGIQGTNGINGLSSYLHIAYANSSDGSIDFNVSDSTNKSYIGQYTDFVQSDSNDYTKYDWTKIKADEKYTWVAYSEYPAKVLGVNNKVIGINGKIIGFNSIGMSLTPTANTKYIGFANNKDTQDGSLSSGDYIWSEYVGKNGENGDKGNYFVYRYAINGSVDTPPAVQDTLLNPAGWTETKPQEVPLSTIWRISAEINGVDSSLIGTWSTPSIETTTSALGVAINNKGKFNPSASYAGTSSQIDVVSYNNVSYYTRTDASAIPVGTLPTNKYYWNPFGATFASLAAGLMLAEEAYIKNLLVDRVKTATSGKRIEINEWNDNSIKLIGIKSHADPVEKETVRIDDGIYAGDEPSGGILCQGMGDSSRIAQMSANGIYANYAGTNPFPPSSGAEGKAAGYFSGKGNVSTSEGDILCGVYGAARNLNITHPCPTYGGYFAGSCASDNFVCSNVVFPSDVQGSSIDHRAGYVSLKTLSSGRMVYMPDIRQVKTGQMITIMGYSGRTHLYVRIPSGDLLSGNDRMYMDFREAYSHISLIKTEDRDGRHEWMVTSANAVDVLSY